VQVHKCDACGDEYKVKDGYGGVILGVIAPDGGKPRDAEGFLAMLKGQPAGEEHYKFDLCYECALSMALAFKKQKADLKAGRRPV
jgi:hypothetical protein